MTLAFDRFGITRARKRARGCFLLQFTSAALALALFLRSAPLTHAQDQIEKVDLGTTLTHALRAADEARDLPPKIAALTDIAGLQAKSSDAARARETLTTILHAAGAVEDVGKRCEMLANISRAMLDAGAAEVAEWSIEEHARLIVRRRPGQALFGIKMENFRQGDAAPTSSKGLNGVFVRAVDKGGPAEQAGIEDGDVIVGIAGQKLADVRSFVNLLATFEPGRSLALEIVREGETKSLTIELGVRSEIMSQENTCFVHRVELKLQLASLQAALGDVTGASRTLTQTRRDIGNLSDRDRNRSLGALATTEAVSGDFEASLATTRTINDPYDRASMYMLIAELLQQNGTKDVAANVISEANEYANVHSESEQHATAFSILAQRLTELGELELAARAAERMKSGQHQASVYAEIAKAWAKGNDHGAAAKTLMHALQQARTIKDEGDRAVALGSLAHVQVKGSLPALLAAAAEINGAREREHTVKEIAAASIAAGDKRGASDALALVPSANSRSELLEEMEMLQGLRAQLANGAPRILRSGPFQDITRYTARAVADAGAGRSGAARAGMRLAVKAIDAFADEQKDTAWGLVVEAYAAMGDIAAAHAAAARIGDPSRRFWTLQEDVLGAQNRLLANRYELRQTARLMVAALETLQDGQDQSYGVSTRALYTISLARLLLQLNQISEAQRIVTRLPDASEWRDKLLGLMTVADAQVQASLTADAVATLTAMRTVLMAAPSHARPEQLGKIAQRQSSLGDVRGAWTWVMKLEAPMERARALIGIAEAQYNASHKSKPKELPMISQANRIIGYRLPPSAAKLAHDEGIGRLSEAISRNARDALAYSERAYLYRLGGKYELAIVDYTNALQLRPNAPLAYFERGSTFFETKSYDAAIADYTRAIRIDGEYEPAYFMRGRSHSAKGRVDRAISDLTQAMKLDPRHVTAMLERGLAYANKRDFTQAITDFDRAIHLHPFHAAPFHARALLKLDAKKLAEALADTVRALQIDPSYAMVYNTRGRIHEAMGRREEAISDYRNALSVQADLLESRQHLRRLNATP